METIIQVSGLNKRYGERHVVNNLSFEIQKGEILCLLGPNGAGKSTTINILSGLLDYDSGSIEYHESPLEAQLNVFKKNLGVVPQDLAIYEDLTAEQNVSFFASLYGLRGKELKQKVQESLDFVGLLQRKGDKVSTYSGGMKRRLNIACAIAHEPELLIMDEPTVGIDPQSRNHILDAIKRLRKQGMTILYTTHYMEEVEAISTRILIMDVGKIIAEGTKECLKEELFAEKQYIFELEEIEALNLDDFYGIEGVKKVEQVVNKIMVTTLKNIENLDKMITLMIQSQCKIVNLTCKTANLENVFLKLTGKSLRD